MLCTVMISNSYRDKCCSLFCKVFFFFFCYKCNHLFPFSLHPHWGPQLNQAKGSFTWRWTTTTHKTKGKKLCSHTEFGPGKKKKSAVTWRTLCLIRHPRQRFGHVMSLLIPWKCDSQKHTANWSASPHLSLVLLGFLGSLGNLPSLYIRLKQERWIRMQTGLSFPIWPCTKGNYCRKLEP